MPKEYATSFYLDSKDINQKVQWIYKYLDDIKFVLEQANFKFSEIIATEKK